MTISNKDVSGIHRIKPMREEFPKVLINKN